MANLVGIYLYVLALIAVLAAQQAAPIKIQDSSWLCDCVVGAMTGSFGELWRHLRGKNVSVLRYGKQHL